MSDLLSLPKSRNARLRELIKTAPPVLAVGSHDALSARLVEQAGFDVVYMGGYATTASLLGRPDVALLSGDQMIDNARRIVETTTVPVIADADTGYGNAVNVIQTVRRYEQAGVSGIHLEDQLAPKRCGHMAGKQVIGADEAVGKIKAAVDARMDPDFVLIARTDALAVEGVDKAIDRALRYSDAGADLLWIEAPTTEAELDRISRRLEGRATLLNWLENGETPMIDHARIKQLGFAMVLFPIGSVFTVLTALREHYAAVRRDGTPLGRVAQLPRFDDFTQAVGLKEIVAIEGRYAAEAQTQTAKPKAA